MLALSSLEQTQNIPLEWLLIGYFGQLVFGTRFIVQLVASERAKRSVVPMVFWYMSLLGGAVLLTYAVYRGDPVFIVGQATGSLVYLRNIYLRLREAKAGVHSE